MKANGVHIDLATNTLHFRDHRPNTCIMQTSDRLAKNMKTASIPHNMNVILELKFQNEIQGKQFIWKR